MNFIESVNLNQSIMTVVAVLTLCLLRGQFKNERYRLKLDLWDRRYEVYHALMELLAASTGTPPSREDIAKFSARTAQKQFLFKDDVLDYIEKVRKNASELRIQTESHKRKGQDWNGDTEEAKMIDEKISELDKWLDDQILIAPKHFQEYLGFKKNL